MLCAFNTTCVNTNIKTKHYKTQYESNVSSHIQLHVSQKKQVNDLKVVRVCNFSSVLKFKKNGIYQALQYCLRYSDTSVIYCCDMIIDILVMTATMND